MSRSGSNSERVVLSDDLDDGVYMHSLSPTLLAYVKDPNSLPDGKRTHKKINPQNTGVVKIDLDSEREVHTDTERFIRPKIFPTGCRDCPPDMNDYATRNLTLHQEPNNLDADPNLYDIKDLTNHGTEYGWINLPNISSDPNFNRSQFIFRSDNYADLTFNGRVDLEDCAVWVGNWLRNDCNSANHWCGFADLNRDENVDFYDLARMADEWLYDTNDPNAYSKLTPKVNGINVLDERHLEAFQRDAVKRFYGRKVPFRKEEREAV